MFGKGHNLQHNTFLIDSYNRIFINFGPHPHNINQVDAQTNLGSLDTNDGGFRNGIALGWTAGKIKSYFQTHWMLCCAQDSSCWRFGSDTFYVLPLSSSPSTISNSKLLASPMRRVYTSIQHRTSEQPVHCTMHDTTHFKVETNTKTLFPLDMYTIFARNRLL